MTIESVLTHHHVNVAHIRHVTLLSLELFDMVKAHYQLPDKARDLLELGALLHDIGITVDPAYHHIIGRDMVLSMDLGISDDKRAIVACLVAFHRKKVRPKSEPAYIRLNKKQRQLALSLAALLRVADGLDYTHHQTTFISDCTIDDNGNVTLTLSGNHLADIEENRAQAMKKADVWHRIFGNSITIHTIAEDDNALTDAHTAAVDTNDMAHTIPLEDDLPVLSDYHVATIARLQHPVTLLFPSSDSSLLHNSVADITRRMLHAFAQTLFAQEDGAREDKDIEVVHDMRVASRRIRAVLPLVALVAPLDDVRSLQKSTRTVARTLAQVRDCDVFLEQVHAWTKTLTPEEQSNMALLTNALLKDRTTARKHMLKMFQSSPYETFKHTFACFITGDMHMWQTQLRLCDCMGSMILQRYEQLRAFETKLHIEAATPHDSVTLHNMRIAGKRLRYLLEMVAEYDASPYITAVLEPLVALQQCLGTIQDIAVAVAYVAQLHMHNDAERAVLHKYCADRNAERDALLTTLPTLWQEITSKLYRRNLMEVIIRL